MAEKRLTYYFIGIGGVGMSALARLCKRQGHIVLGYDRTASPITYALEEEGVFITYESSIDALPKEVLGKDVEVVYTAAISENHPQLMYYTVQGNRIRKRATFLADCCKNSKVLAVAGTHGKTTTSAILTHIFLETEQSFSSIMGGFFNGNNSNLIGEGSEFMIVDETGLLLFIPIIPHITIYDFFCNFLFRFVLFSLKLVFFFLLFLLLQILRQ